MQQRQCPSYGMLLTLMSLLRTTIVNQDLFPIEHEHYEKDEFSLEGHFGFKVLS